VRISGKDKDKKGLFSSKRHMDFYWYGKRGIKRKIKGDCGYSLVLEIL